MTHFIKNLAMGIVGVIIYFYVSIELMDTEAKNYFAGVILISPFLYNSKKKDANVNSKKKKQVESYVDKKNTKLQTKEKTRKEKTWEKLKKESLIKQSKKSEFTLKKKYYKPKGWIQCEKCGQKNHPNSISCSKCEEKIY